MIKYFFLLRIVSVAIVVTSPCFSLWQWIQHIGKLNFSYDRPVVKYTVLSMGNQQNHTSSRANFICNCPWFLLTYNNYLIVEICWLLPLTIRVLRILNVEVYWHDSNKHILRCLDILRNLDLHWKTFLVWCLFVLEDHHDSCFPSNI